MTKKIRRRFRRLNRHNYNLTSPKTRKYNCIAWAAGENKRWWEPAPGYYWPSCGKDGNQDDHTPEALAAAYAGIGYIRCETPDSEIGYEKVALYVDADGWWSHAARQLPSGTWTSKLGTWQDISHDDPQLLIGDSYGTIYCFMKRPVRESVSKK